MISRPEVAFLEPAHGAGAAGVAVAERRQRRGLAERVAVRQLGIDSETPFARQHDILCKIDAGDVVLDLAARNRRVQAHRHAGAGRRKQRSVARVVLPSGDEIQALDLRADEVLIDLERVAVLSHPLQCLLRAERTRQQLGILICETERQPLEVRDRVTPIHAGGEGLRRKIRSHRRELRDVLIGKRHRARDAVDVAVRVGEVDVVDLLILAAAQLERHATPRAHEVRVNEVAAERNAERLGEAEAAAELPRQPFLDLEVDVDQIRTARHRRRLRLDLFDVGQLLQRQLRTLDQVVREITALELAHLAAEDLVIDVVGTVEVDAANVNAIARIDEERDRGLFGFLVELGHGAHFRERVTVLAETQRHELLALRQHCLRKRVAGCRENQPFEILLRDDHLAGELDVGNRVAVAFRDADRHEDVAFVGRDRHLHVVGTKIREPAVHVVRAQLLEIAFERLLRVAVVLANERHPVARWTARSRR